MSRTDAAIANDNPPKRRPGRPSVAAAQRARIVEAYVEEVRAHGLAKASVDRVAATLGVSRTLVFHYFGDLRVLTRAVVEHILKNAVRDISAGREGMTLAQRRKALVKFAIAGAHFDHLDDVGVMAEIEGLAAHDESIMAIIREMWDVQLDAVVAELRACYPEASLADCKALGYALSCLGEQHWQLSFFAPGAKQAAAVQRACEILLATLETSSSRKR